MRDIEDIARGRRPLISVQEVGEGGTSTDALPQVFDHETATKISAFQSDGKHHACKERRTHQSQI